MKKNLFLRLCLMMTVMLSLYSCHNEDFANQDANSKRNNTDFFKHSKNGGLNAKSGVDYIAILEAHNEEHNFLATMPDQEGMPIWNKMQVVDTEETTGLMIPLSHDDETMSSILFATLDGENLVTGVKDYDNILLKDIVYDQRISKENRENLFLTFMQMDNRTFGNEHFIGIPKDMFVGEKSDDEYGIMWVRNFAPPSSVNVKQNGKLMIIETCFIALHCTHHGPGICDAEEGCTECGTTFCSYEVIGTADDPFPSTPGGGGCSGCGGGGGGGGTSPGPNVPTNPCGLNVGNVFYRLAPGCGGGGVLPILEDPCEKIKSKFADIKFKEKVTAIDKPEVFDYDHEMGYASAYPDASTGATETQYELMENNPNTHKVKLPDGNQYFGYMHSHTNDTATEATVKIFSPADVSTFLTSCVSNADEHLSIGDAYSMVITSQGNYMLQYTGTGNYSIGQNQIDNWKKWYLTEFQKIQKEDGSFNQNDVEKLFPRFLKESVKIDGLEVYQVEKNTGKASKLNTNGTKTPCPLY